MKATFKLPHVFWVDERRDAYTVQQIVKLSCTVDGSVANYSSTQLKGKIISSTDNSGSEILIVNKIPQTLPNFGQILLMKWRESNGNETFLDLSTAKWIKHPSVEGLLQPVSDYGKQLQTVIDSWENGFSYFAENPLRKLKGLRPPQIGAVHAAHAHWAVSEEVATIVMPTGTGKTETMLSVLVSIPCSKIFVVVPTDALRTQIANKFLTLGVLKDSDCKVLHDKALHPIVGILKQIPKTVSDIDSLFEKCHVVVTTSQIAGRSNAEVQERVAHHCPFLFIDEAHHVAAPTWSAFKEKFRSRRILQFTATPFREDDKPVEGKAIFKYPLKKAQAENYFKPIRFREVFEFDPTKADRVIAAEAIAQLREDEKYKHILMARVDSVDRAKQVFQIYKKYEEFNPVEIHTGIKSITQREQIRQKILSGESRIVVCVNMLGEGFDLPELKIAAFHDIRKGLAVTLQVAGRFTRSRPDLGNATVIANLADVNVREELRKLYVRDTDWNVLLPQLSEEVIEEQIRLDEFVKGVANFPDDIPLKNICPALSTVVYKTKCTNWNPENFRKGIPGIKSFERVHFGINYEDNVLIIVTAQKVPIDWAGTPDIFNWNWELYIVFWDQTQNLLFIHNSNNNGYFKPLAEAVAGDVEMIKEQTLFRCFYGVNRIRLQNVGLTEKLGRLIRYTGRMGADVEAGLTGPQILTASKSVIFGNGYENGKKVTIGASRKGRIWSFATANILVLTRWCKAVGAKLLNEDIDPDQVLKGTLESEIIGTRPPLMPVTVDWPEDVYKDTETAYTFIFSDGTESLLLHTDIRLKDGAEEGDLKFELSAGSASVWIVLTLHEKDGVKDCTYSIVGDQRAHIKHRGVSLPVEKFFYEQDPVFWFVDGSSLEGNKHTRLKVKYPPYDKQKIEMWDWLNIDLKKESQGVTKESDSIQYHVIQELKKGNYDIIFDDDDKGEAADVVTIRIAERDNRGNIIEVEFYHCKYSKGKSPGRRIGDLYEVCGQAQKSIHWMESYAKQVELFTHLLRREPKRKEGQEATRFEKGSRNDLIKIREMSRVLPMELKIFIVQPGLSQADASDDQLQLLSVTENHLMETYKLPFGVIASRE